MEVYRRSSWLVLLVLELQLFFIAQKGAYGELDIQEGPSESECRPYIEKALKQLETGDPALPSQDDGDSQEDIPTIEITIDEFEQPAGYEENENDSNKNDSEESTEIGKQEQIEGESNERDDESNEDNTESDTENNTENDKSEEQAESDEIGVQELTLDQVLAPEPEPELIRVERTLALESEPEVVQETVTESIDSQEVNTLDEKDDEQITVNIADEVETQNEDILKSDPNKQENEDSEYDNDPIAAETDDISSKENDIFLKEEELETPNESVTDDATKEAKDSKDIEHEIIVEQSEEKLDDNIEIFAQDSEESSSKENVFANEDKQSDYKFEDEDEKDSKTEAQDTENEDDNDRDSKQDTDSEKTDIREDIAQDTSSEKIDAVEEEKLESISSAPSKEESDNSNEPESKESEEALLVEELTEGSEEDTLELRPRNHIAQLLKLDENLSSNLKIVDRTSEIILKDLKKLYESAIKPLEILYKYKDLSNRHFGDPEIFAKPLILFMGPWSGGKSSIINYLLGIEYSDVTLHTGAEPSPAYFNILTYGEEPEVLDGIQLAADYTFSGLQKFGQGLEERLRGYKLPSKLLEKVNIVEIPGILEVRKQVSRVFPFNDACQWFIDRADIIFLVYDPSKLDVGPETEAILDQLKGREHQTRIVLNKADQVKPEELMRVQGALIWNISPLMSSAQPPVMYTTSLWSRPYETWAPVRLLQAQERAFLRDIRTAVDKRIDNKIASARRFAVRVRNHAKMVDCYLTTYYNHKSVFGNRKQISDEIINHPQDFHIYEGLSTLTNISRYDLPDPEVYREFFRLNALYDFQQLSATCTYFRGCPINRLDVAIAYDLPELVGKHKKLIETTINEAHKVST